ncbi:MAG: RimK family alpha-L-glutamate ligase [Thermodesulfobacteriota bacterium]|nr:RimK family alpha-L-glutamate ligase [Thermodesulfobacteriota bacterium]
MKRGSSGSGREKVSLGKRLRGCPSFRCLGVRPNWEDYSVEERDLIRGAAKIYYPSRLYETFFLSTGKDVFPRNYYEFMGNKIRQTGLFQLLDVSHPRTKVYYGRRPSPCILSDFTYPFIAKDPLGSSQGSGVWRIENRKDLERYLARCRPAYIQEYLPIDRDLRVVLIAGRVVHAYWRVAPPGEFRNNVSLGASLVFDAIPEDALDFARDVACRCRFGEVGLDICRHDGRYYVLEANMVYGLEGFHRRCLNIHELLKRLDDGGTL